MRHLSVLVFVMGVIVASCQCSTGPCADVKCGGSLVCDMKTGACVPGSTGGAGGSAGEGGSSSMGGAGGGAVDAGCMASCAGATPVCDPRTNTCKTCLADNTGCSGTTPYCSTFDNNGDGKCMTCTMTAGCMAPKPFCEPTFGAAGSCIECRSNDDCPNGKLCNQFIYQCFADDGGFGGNVVWLDGGTTNRCLSSVGGTMSCTTECPKGFACVNGSCRLNGGNGPVQVTLRFPDDEDLDLHVVEPLPDAGTCEIYYAQPNVDAGFVLPFQRFCGAKGWLDIDSNAACRLDHVRVENVIYPVTATATPGTYIVRVDYYQRCGSTSPVPYEVEIRANGETRFYCGSFTGSQGGQTGPAGRTIATFTLR